MEHAELLSMHGKTLPNCDYILFFTCDVHGQREVERQVD